MATVYVSTTGNDTTGTGSFANPYLTFTKADSVIGPGDTVLVEPGTYTYSSVVAIATNGTVGSRITWQADGAYGSVHLVGTMNNTDLFDTKGNYCDIIGFDVSGSLVKIGLSNWGHHNRILHCSAHDVGTGLAATAPGAGFFDYSGVTTIGLNEWAYNKSTNCGPAGSSTCTTFHGFYLGTTSAFIHDNLSCSHASWGFAIAGIDTNNFQTVVNNTSFNNTFGGFKMTGEGTTNADNNVVANNISCFNGRLGLTGTGFIDQANIGTNNVYKNNCTFGNVGVNYSLQHATPTATVTTDPQFVNYQGDGSGDYHLKATSPCIDAGASTSPAPTLDYSGIIRPQSGIIDIGAFEFVPAGGSGKGGLSLRGA